MPNKKKPSFKQSLINLRRNLSYPILKQPENIKRQKTRMIILSIIIIAILDSFSFALKGAETAIESGYVKLSILLLVLYFAERVVGSTYNTYNELLNDNFSLTYNTEITQIVMVMCNKTRNKVWKSDDEQKEVVFEVAETLQKVKNYIDAAWNFWWKIPTTISSVITLIILITGMIMIELRENAGISTFIIVSLLVICIAVFIKLAIKRIEFKKSYRKMSQENRAKEDVLFTEVKNIEYISEEDFNYHANRLRKQLTKTRELAKVEHLKLNKVYIGRSVLNAGFMIAILVIKLCFTTEINLMVILDIIAVSNIYSKILSKIADIIAKFEDLMDTIIDMEALSDDFSNINNVFEEESSKKFSSLEVDKVTCDTFEATQDPRKMYLLKNETPFELNKKDIVLVQGPTGCGKSTLLLLLTGKLKIKTDPIEFSNGNRGYLQSIDYQTDKAIANNFVINEILLSDTEEGLDTDKLLKILHGLCLYPELLRMAKATDFITEANLSDDEMVIEVIRKKKTREFSSGQQQRLALTKLLYIMGPTHQVISLDEAFNRLDDKTANACMNFVSKFTQEDTHRIVLLATHQIELAKPYCNKEISFSNELNTAYMSISNL